MGERYSKIFSYEKNLYMETSPILIEAGALYKDNKTDRYVSQFKFKNVSDHVIKAVKIEINHLDIACRSLGSKTNYQYLDLYVKGGDEFGQKILIPLENHEIRSFNLQIIEVIFFDNSLWTPYNTNWESIPKQILLEKYLNDYELAKQYRIKYGSMAKYQPEIFKGAVLCTCGEPNLETKRCNKCHVDIHKMLTMNLDVLKEEKDLRIQLEKDRVIELKRRSETENKNIIKRINEAKIDATILIGMLVAPILTYLVVFFIGLTLDNDDFLTAALIFLFIAHLVYIIMIIISLLKQIKNSRKENIEANIKDYYIGSWFLVIINIIIIAALVIPLGNTLIK